MSALFECTRAQASGAHCLGISDEAAHTGLAGAFIFGETSGAVTDVTVLYNTCAAPPRRPAAAQGISVSGWDGGRKRRYGFRCGGHARHPCTWCSRHSRSTLYCNCSSKAARRAWRACRESSFAPV